MLSPLTDDEKIKQSLSAAKIIAMVGVSSVKKENTSNIIRRPSIIVMNYLQEFGYRVIPVNPFSAGKKINGDKKRFRIIDMSNNFNTENIENPINVQDLSAVKLENYDYLNSFVNKISEAGCKTIILHARKAILKGLTPKENLKIPKLNYPLVYEIKKTNKNLEIVINGGITNTEQIEKHLKNCDYIYKIEDGEIIESGIPEKILQVDN